MLLKTLFLGDPDPLDVYFKKLGQKARELFEGRNATLYTWIMSDNTIFEPADIITEQMGRDSLAWANGRLKLVEHMVIPVLNSRVMKGSDEDIQQLFEQYDADMTDPDKRKEFAQRTAEYIAKMFFPEETKE